MPNLDGEMSDSAGWPPRGCNSGRGIYFSRSNQWHRSLPDGDETVLPPSDLSATRRNPGTTTLWRASHSEGLSITVALGIAWIVVGTACALSQLPE
jgi:hypothetical protein